MSLKQKITTKKSSVKGIRFVKVLKEEIKANPGIRGANYATVRDNVCRKLDISKREFDEILGYLIHTERLQNVWLFTGFGQVKIYHKNMQLNHPFDSIEEVGKGIQYKTESVKNKESGKLKNF